LFRFLGYSETLDQHSPRCHEKYCPEIGFDVLRCTTGEQPRLLSAQTSFVNSSRSRGFPTAFEMVKSAEQCAGSQVIPA
jgi:hypothetical protein